ncbi:MAG: hypothetical protein HEEMFOPI_01096 [Holosporales bacterium]
MLFKLKLINFSLLTTTVCTFAMQSHSVPFPSYRKTKNFSPYLILAEKAEELTQYIEQRKTEQTTFYALHTQCDNFSVIQEQLKHKLEAFLKKIEDDEQVFLTLKEEHQKKLEEHTKKYDALYLELTEKMDAIEKNILQLNQPSIEEFEALKAQIKTLATQTKNEKVKIAELENVLTLLKKKASLRNQSTERDEQLTLHKHQLEKLHEDAKQMLASAKNSSQKKGEQNKEVQAFRSTCQRQLNNTANLLVHLHNGLARTQKSMNKSKRTHACQTIAIAQQTSPTPLKQHILLRDILGKFKLDTIMPKIFDVPYIQGSSFYHSFKQDSATFLKTLDGYIEKIAEQNEKKSLQDIVEKTEPTTGLHTILETIITLYEGTKNPDAHPALNAKYAQFLIFTWVNLRYDSSFTLLKSLEQNIFPRIDKDFKEMIICSVFKILFSIAKTLKSDQKKEQLMSSLFNNHTPLTNDILKPDHILNFETYTLIIDFLEFLSTNNFKLDGSHFFAFIKIYSIALQNRCICAILSNSEYKKIISTQDMNAKDFFVNFALTDIMLKKQTFTKNDLSIICDAIKTLKYTHELKLGLTYLKNVFTQKKFNVVNVRAIMSVCEKSKISDMLIQKIHETGTPEEKQNYKNICRSLIAKK